MGTCATKLQKEDINGHNSPQLINTTNNNNTSQIISASNEECTTNGIVRHTNKMEDIWRKNKILVYGYVEENYHHHFNAECKAIAIPIDIIDIILKFYDDIFYWSFENGIDDNKNKGNNNNNNNNISFDDFLNTSNGETIWSESIKIENGIIFQFSTCPDGWFPFQKGYVQFYLEVIEIPKNIKEIEVEFKVYCDELKCEWIDKNKFNRIPQAIGWPRYNMKLSECNKYNALHFYCLLKVINIKYKGLINHLNEFHDDDDDDEDEEEEEEDDIGMKRKRKRMTLE